MLIIWNGLHYYSSICIGKFNTSAVFWAMKQRDVCCLQMYWLRRQIKAALFWNMTPHSLEEFVQHFRRVQYLHLQLSRWRQLISFYETKWRHIPENLSILVIIAARNLNPVCETLSIYLADSDITALCLEVRNIASVVESVMSAFCQESLFYWKNCLFV